MKYFIKIKNDYKEDAISLNGADNRIINVAKVEENRFRVQEECDGCFDEIYTKDELNEMLNELKNWIDKN